ncbi:MAG TPA: NADH-quinone oxidoreductase subunit J [Pirellulales bacterium]
MLLLSVLLVFAGLYLMLPPRGQAARVIGAALNGLALALLVTQFIRPDGPVEIISESNVFWIIGVATVGCGLAAVTSQNPVYSALWFGLTLLGTAGLFLLIGAQFLAAATVVVYAGAILVTFLFVLMLATANGSAPHDRLSWEREISAAVGAVIIGVLAVSLAKIDKAPPLAIDSTPKGGEARQQEILHPAHLARMGRELFSTHLVAVEAAGMLLFVGLVGAAAIVAHGRARDRDIGGALPPVELNLAPGRATAALTGKET